MAETTTSEYGRPWRLLAVIVVLFVLSALALISPFLREEKESHYPTLAEAKRDGAIERGWLPPWLPGSAVEINEIHDVDSNRGFIALRYASSDEGRYKSACQRIVGEVPPNPEPRVKWWHKDRNNIVWRDYMFFSCFRAEYNTELKIAVHDASHKAYIWLYPRYAR
jgi:hypothetical protein